MKANNIYQRAFNNGVELIGSCVSLSEYKCEELMLHKTKANKKKCIRLAILAGLDVDKRELKYSYYNPYEQWKTNTHIIYRNSGIEYFLKIN